MRYGNVAVINPLTDQHCQCINQVLRSIPDIMDTIKACEDCGLDMSQQREIAKAQEEFANKVKQVFMPNHI